MSAGDKWELPGGHQAIEVSGSTKTAIRRFSVEQIQAAFYYDSLNGIIYHATEKYAQHKLVATPGQIAGSWRRDDTRIYLYCRLNGASIPGHVVAWVCYYGKWPDGVIDHINGNCQDNRIVNLRDCKQAFNMRNRRLNKNSNSGFKGVTWFPQLSKWRARIAVNGKKYCLGFYLDAKEAAKAYDNGAIRLHGQYAKTNRDLGLI